MIQDQYVYSWSEPALNLLPVAELQAVVVHELGHEYFWGELMEARQRKERATAREIELHCDGIIVIALRRLGLDPPKLISSIATIRSFIARMISMNRLNHPLLEERSRFIRAINEAAAKVSAPQVTAESSRSPSRTDQ